MHPLSSGSAVLLCLSLVPSFLRAVTVSPLLARGYTVLPAPQRVTLGARDFPFSSDWQLNLSPGITPDDVAVLDLKERLHERFGMSLASDHSASAPALRFQIKSTAVAVGNATDRNHSALIAQAYKITLSPRSITITGNTSVGLFYGVQTLVQLLKPQDGKLWLPEGQIEDWPDLELRVIYWDDAHHLEHLDVLKAALRQASFYKVNGFALKLEGHFQYRHAQPIVDPYALSPAELQELTDYGLRYHVELIPYLDGPAHDAFILKHPEYAKLRASPDSNYEFCTTNPQTYSLLEGMFADLLEANKGGKYFVLSTDEPYYVGLADNAQCAEASRAKDLGSVGKLLAEFITKTAAYLHAQGRTILFWGEYPLKPDDIAALPNYLVNGEVYGPDFDPVFRAHGIRQMIYTSTEGEEQLFPQYYILPSADRLHPAVTSSGRVQEMVDAISLTSLADLSSTRSGPARADQADLMGALVAGWADAGLHPETFWLGYATGPAAAWNRQGPAAEELQNTFYPLFYGPGNFDMGHLYQLMSHQAQFWEDSWDKGPSAARTPIWGNSYAIYHPPHPALDQFLPPLPVPSPELLRLNHDWQSNNQQRINLAASSLARNDQLLDLLYHNLRAASFNRYNLQVFLSLARLYRQNLTMIGDLAQIAEALQKAEAFAAESDSRKALNALDHALDLAQGVRDSRNQVLRDTTETWYQSWFPRVKEANGRTYLHQLDDVKDHQPMRTIDMSYLVYRELLYPLDDWAARTVAARNAYAVSHGLSERNFTLSWKQTE